MNRLESFTDPIIFAHRGASLHAPENTMASFELAVEQGADAIELDVKLSRDKQVVIFHDDTLQRTTNGSGRIKDHLFADLQKLDAGSHFSEKFKNERIPCLSEVLDRIGSHIYINIELTNYASPFDSLPVQAAKIVKEHKQQKNILFSSFNFLTLYRIRRLLPEVPAAILALPGPPGILSRSFIGRWFAARAVHPHLKDVSPAYIRRERQHGRRIHVWTVNDPKAMHNLYQFGVHGIFTDDPLLALQIRERA